MNKYIFISFLSILCVTNCGLKGKKDSLITIKTKYGEMKAILFDDTPKHKENFIKLAQEHFFDSLLFHRVIDGFMIQGGDPTSKNAPPNTHLGTGGPGYTIDAEIRPNHFHQKGALSAARLGDQQNPEKKSSGSQFYVVQGSVLNKEQIDNLQYNQNLLMTGLRTMFEKPENKDLLDSLNQLYLSNDMDAYQNRIIGLAPRVERETGLQVFKPISEERKKLYSTVGGSPHLDNEYTVFGQIISGLDVIDKIAKVAKDDSDRPIEDITMTVTVEEISRKKITKEYGYVYPAVEK